MRYIKRNIHTIIAIIGFALVIGSYSIYKINDNLFLGLIGTIATLYFGSIKYKIENDIFFKDLFKDFNSRYDNQINDLINELKFDNENNKNRDLNKRERNLIIDYLNLCSEEYFWRSRNRIPKEVWDSWKAGIKENLDIPVIKKVYEEEIENENAKKSFYGLVEELA